MAKVKRVEKSIWDVEGFSVRILYHTGVDVRSDREGVPVYPFDRAAKNEITVESWKAQRFRPNYPGFEVDVLDGDGDSVNGNTKLATVRDSYLDD